MFKPGGTRRPPLLRVKLVPPSAGLAILRRGRLVDRLRDGLEHPERRGTAVVAGAGYGKTSLLSDFLRDADPDIVWYSLDPSDQDPSVFFRYVIEGIRQRCDDFGNLAGEILEDPTADIEQFIDVLINDANETLNSRVCLILDDFHHLDGSRPIMAAIRRLLTYLPDSLHVILASRTSPDIGLSRLRSTGRVDLIDQQDLLFTADETRELFTSVLGAGLEARQLDDLQARSQGWVTALQIFRQQAGEGGEVPSPAGGSLGIRSREEIFDFFSDDVFSRLDEPSRVFLMRSSLPSVLDTEVVVRVLEDLPVRGLIEGLLRRNLFIVPLSGRSDCHSYHPLFREFLMRKLRQIEGDRAERDLHVRYARLFEERRDFASALQHYMRAGHREPLADLLAREGWELLGRGMLETVRRACEVLEESGKVPAAIHFLRAEISRIEGDYATASRRIDAGLAAPRSVTSPERAGALQVKAYAEQKLGNLDGSIALAEEALRLAGDGELALQARILNTLSIAEYRAGTYEKAIAGWQKALNLARRGGDQPLLRKIAHNLGLPYGMLGDYDKALGYFRILIDRSDEAPPGPEYATASLNVARIEILQGELRAAAEHLDDALEICRKFRLRALTGDVQEAQGNLLRELGDLEAARAKYGEARVIATELGLGDLLEDIEEDHVLLLLASGSAEEAVRKADALLREAPDGADTADRRAAVAQLAGHARLALPAPPVAEAVLHLKSARDLFRTLRFRFQEAASGLMLARARLMAGERDAAQVDAIESLRLVKRHGYRHMARRLASGEPLRGFLAAMPEAADLVPQERKDPLPESVQVGGALGGFDLTINLLGPVEVYRDEARRIPASAWSLKRALRILCFLVTSREHRATKDRIMDTFWRDADPDVIRKNFHPTISYLRKALNLHHPVNKSFILFEKGAYLLNPEYRYRIDCDEMEASVRRARKHATGGLQDAALAEYGRAMDLYRGEFLEEEYEEWVDPLRTHYAGLFRECLEEAGALHVQAGQVERALECFRRLTASDPVSESASCRVMEVLGLMRNRAGVEQEFARLREVLLEELELEPLPETVEAYERAKAGPDASAGS